MRIKIIPLYALVTWLYFLFLFKSPKAILLSLKVFLERLCAANPRSSIWSWWKNCCQHRLFSPGNACFFASLFSRSCRDASVPSVIWCDSYGILVWLHILIVFLLYQDKARLAPRAFLYLFHRFQLIQHSLLLVNLCYYGQGCVASPHQSRNIFLVELWDLNESRKIYSFLKSLLVTQYSWNLVYRLELHCRDWSLLLFHKREKALQSTSTHRQPLHLLLQGK